MPNIHVEPTALPAEPLDRRDRAAHRLADGVVGSLVAGQPPAGEGEHRRVQAPVQRLPCVGVAPAGAVDQIQELIERHGGIGGHHTTLRNQGTQRIGGDESQPNSVTAAACAAHEGTAVLRSPPAIRATPARPPGGTMRKNLLFAAATVGALLAAPASAMAGGPVTPRTGPPACGTAPGKALQVVGLTADSRLICFRESSPATPARSERSPASRWTPRSSASTSGPPPASCTASGTPAASTPSTPPTRSATLHSRLNVALSRDVLRRRLQPDGRPAPHRERRRPEPAGRRHDRRHHGRRRAHDHAARRRPPASPAPPTPTTTPIRTRPPRCSTSTRARPGRHPGAAQQRPAEPHGQAGRGHERRRRRSTSTRR